MKILILNLPYHHKIIRRYSCSYHAVGFLYPPIELLRIASILEQNSTFPNEIVFIDAIAQNKDKEKCLHEIIQFHPDIIITLLSVDFINYEYDFVKELQVKFDGEIIGIGYLPYKFQGKFDQLDVILGNNFETIFYKACQSLRDNNVEKFIELLNFYKQQPGEFDPDIVRQINLSYVNDLDYQEFFCKGKTAFTYFSFGCPYHCSFCIRTYDLKKAYFRKTEHILMELKDLYDSGYRNVRIMDDNCTLNRQLLSEILEFLTQNKISLNFYGLTRLDLINDETIELLSNLNFKRIYLGIETLSPLMQKEYDKNINIKTEVLRKLIGKLSEKGIETAIFLLFNPLNEKRKDLKMTLSILKKVPVDFVDLTAITPYPGTAFFEKNINNIHFSLDPDYISEIPDSYKQNMNRLQLYFFFSFYVFNFKRLLLLIKRFVLYPKQSIQIFKEVFSSVFRHKNDRQDFV